MFCFGLVLFDLSFTYLGYLGLLGANAQTYPAIYYCLVILLLSFLCIRLVFDIYTLFFNYFKPMNSIAPSQSEVSNPTNTTGAVGKQAVVAKVLMKGIYDKTKKTGR